MPPYDLLPFSFLIFFSFSAVVLFDAFIVFLLSGWISWWLLFIACKWDGRAIRMTTRHIRLPAVMSHHTPNQCNCVLSGSLKFMALVMVPLRQYLPCVPFYVCITFVVVPSFSIRIISGNGLLAFHAIQNSADVMWIYQNHKTKYGRIRSRRRSSRRLVANVDTGTKSFRVMRCAFRFGFSIGKWVRATAVCSARHRMRQSWFYFRLYIFVNLLLFHDWKGVCYGLRLSHSDDRREMIKRRTFLASVLKVYASTSEIMKIMRKTNAKYWKWVRDTNSFPVIHVWQLRTSRIFN